MSFARKHAEEPQGHAQKRVSQIIHELEVLIEKISDKKDYEPLQKEVDALAKSIIDVVATHHHEIKKFEIYLKNAIIDLTEVPYMQPQMQKIAFEVSIRAAIKNLHSFLQHTFS